MDLWHKLFGTHFDTLVYVGGWLEASIRGVSRVQSATVTLQDSIDRKLIHGLSRENARGKHRFFGGSIRFRTRGKRWAGSPDPVIFDL